MIYEISTTSEACYFTQELKNLMISRNIGKIKIKLNTNNIVGNDNNSKCFYSQNVRKNLVRLNNF